MLTNDNKPVTATDNVTLCNLFSAALWSHVECHLNGTQVADLSSITTYPWKAYLETLLSYDAGPKNTFLRAEGWTNETVGDAEADLIDLAAANTTPGLKKRRTWIVGPDKTLCFSSRLALDVFQTDRYLPPNVDIKLKFVRPGMRFGLLQDDTLKFKLVLKDLKLVMRKVLPTLEVRERFKKQLALKPCFLPYKAVKLTHYIVPQGLSSFHQQNVTTGVLPKMIIFFFVRNEAMNMTDGKVNPFNFGHQNVSAFNVKRNGQSVFSKPLTADFANDNAIELYRHLFDNIGILHGNASIDLSYEHFKTTKFLMAVDFTPDRCGLYHTHKDGHGNIDIELSFSQNLPAPVYLFAYSVYDSGIQIDGDLQVKKTL